MEQRAKIILRTAIKGIEKIQKRREEINRAEQNLKLEIDAMNNNFIQLVGQRTAMAQLLLGDPNELEEAWKNNTNGIREDDSKCLP